MVKHHGFVTFLLPRPPGDSWVPWLPPGCILGASWVPPGCLLGASWVPPGSLLGASVWGLTLESYCIYCVYISLDNLDIVTIILIHMSFIPQTELAMRGSNGVGLEGAMKSLGNVRPRVRQCLLLFTVLGEGRARLVHANWSVAPLSMVKHNGFVTFSFQDLLETPGCPG